MTTRTRQQGPRPAGAPAVKPLFRRYRPHRTAYDELFSAPGVPRPGAAEVVALLDQLGQTEFRTRQRLANNVFLKSGITFSVYSDHRGVERIFPFDLVPRVVSAADWARLERGLEQRVRAHNAFLADIYGAQRILAEGRVPRALVETAVGYLPAVRGLRPPGGVYVHVAGIDLVRMPSGEFVVLEDNLRTPSGVSYVLENRDVMKRVLPESFARAHVRPVDEYPTRLRQALAELSPLDPDETCTMVLTPGIHNSAYFEHSFLARRMGCELVHGSDLFVHDDRLYAKTTAGPSQVHVIYRRVDDQFLDPQVFRRDSVLGVPGLLRAYAAGQLTLANAVGNGVADDKALYAYVPELIRFYLSEEPLLGQVETLVCARPADLRRTLDELPRLVVKAVDASGGYGMLIGPSASRAELAAFADLLRANPRGYIAQPRVELSTCPTWSEQGVRPCRIDLRPYIITGRSSWVLPGGLTRVALAAGSYVVNSSQGGGSKDTWVLEAPPTAERAA